jgi:hypothetical protein
MKRLIVVTTAALLLASTASAAGPIIGKVGGAFFRGGYPLDSGNLKRYIKTSKVWCAWQDGKVLVHVQMRNTSAEHVTVNWYPRYSISAGGIHGDGFSSAESSGFDSGEVRQLIAKEGPKGVKVGARIALCRPHFRMIQSG